MWELCKLLDTGYLLTYLQTHEEMTPVMAPTRLVTKNSRTPEAVFQDAVVSQPCLNIRDKQQLLTIYTVYIYSMRAAFTRHSIYTSHSCRKKFRSLSAPAACIIASTNSRTFQVLEILPIQFQEAWVPCQLTIIKWNNLSCNL